MTVYMTSGLDTSVQYLKGVGPYLSKVLSKIGILTVRDMLFYFPRDWEDRRNLPPIADIRIGEDTIIKGRIIKVTGQRTKRGFNLVKAVISDQTGSICCTWFNQKFVKNVLEKNKGQMILVSGKAEHNAFSSGTEFAVKEYELVDASGLENVAIVPKYPLTGGLYQKRIRKITKLMVDGYVDKVSDPLPDSIKRGQDLATLKDAIRHIHFPSDMKDVEFSRKRLAFDDLFMLQLMLAMRRKETRMEGRGIQMNVGSSALSRFESSLPFTFTGAQKKVLEEIRGDMFSSKPMNRLIQGDVGSGKTIVAVAAAVIASGSGYQTAIMAPTQILAKQHYEKISGLVKGLGITVHLITGADKKKKRQDTKDRISKDDASIIVGTHALISQGIDFSKLGLVVIDEQHRFGIGTRAQLTGKGKDPHVLVMTATPIPRTLSLTLYGDLDRSIIDELPPGRTPVVTKYVDSPKRRQMYEFIRQKVSEGKQAYVVCPLIEESEKSDLAAAKETAEELAKVFAPLNVSLLHGKMKPAEKDSIMDGFKNNKINILVSTTVIEVGIDVPNAVIMLIEHVERFGLSQLHQLRGRIGRGAAQSYCFLAGKPSTPESRERVRTMVETTDGFKIAEADLRLRGPGEFFGNRQSGIPEFKMADLIRDEQILRVARKCAFEVVLDDPDLIKEENNGLRAEIDRRISDFAQKDMLN